MRTIKVSGICASCKTEGVVYTMSSFLLPSFQLCTICKSQLQIVKVIEAIKKTKDTEDNIGKPIIGVYFLCLCKKINYIGRSFHILGRINNHAVNKVMEFDSVYYITIPTQSKEVLDLFERILIDLFQPFYNTTYREAVNFVKPPISTTTKKHQRKVIKNLKSIRVLRPTFYHPPRS